MIGGFLFLLALTLGVYDLTHDFSFQQSMLQAKTRDSALWLIDCLIAAGEDYLAKHPEGDGWIPIESLQLPSGIFLSDTHKNQFSIYTDAAARRLYIVIGPPNISGLAAALQHRYACGIVPATKDLTTRPSEMVYRYVGWAQGGSFHLVRALVLPGENKSTSSLPDVTVPNAIPESSLLVLCTR